MANNNSIIMKSKFITLFCAVCLIANASNVYAYYDFSAVAPSGQTLYYNISGSNAIVTYPGSTSNHYFGYTKPEGNLEIPSSVDYNGNTYSVTSIGDEAFNYCSGLTSVTIPNSVSSIGWYAFYGCSGLTSVTIPNSVSSIRNHAFDGCSGLISVEIPNSVTSIGNETFYGCSGLNSVFFNADSCVFNGGYSYSPFHNNTAITSFTIGDSVRYIPNDLCSGLSGLTTLTIGNSVTSIGEWAFYGCSGLTSVTIPNSVTSIGYGTFSSCSGLTSVTIGGSVTSIGQSAFSGCSGLDTVYMKPTTPPALGFSAFSNNASGRVFILSGCSYNDYYNASSWTSHQSALRDPMIDINISLVANNALRGEVSIIQVRNHDVRCDSTAVIQAIANYGYHFTQWNDGNTDNPRTITLTQDTVLTAHFDKNEYQLTLNNATPTLGTITGSGTYLYLDTVNITATAIAHYHFTHWNDGDTENPRNIVILCDTTLTANFAIDTHTVSVAVNDLARGMVSTTGTEFAYGTPCTLTATAYTGYTFAGWSNGVTANPYTFAVLNDVELTAVFLSPNEQSYTVTVSSADPTMGSVTVNGNASATVMSGETVTLATTANVGYHFVRWNDNDTNAIRTVIITSDTTFIAYFEADVVEETYTVTVASADPTMGTVSGGGQAVDGGSVVIRAAGNPGYHFTQWDDGNTDSVRTVVVHGNVTYTAYFAPDNGTEGIDGVATTNIRLYQRDGQIVVEDADGGVLPEVVVYDAVGRKMETALAGGAPAYQFEVPTSGVYLVKIGDRPARRIVVIR